MLLPLILMVSQHLANGVATLFINDKPNLVNEARTLPRNLSFWCITFLVVLVNNISLFSRYLIAFIIPFISLYVVLFQNSFFVFNWKCCFCSRNCNVYIFFHFDVLLFFFCCELFLSLFLDWTKQLNLIKD